MLFFFHFFSSLGRNVLSYDTLTPILIDTSAIRRGAYYLLFLYFAAKLNVLLKSTVEQNSILADVMPTEKKTE